MNKKFPKVSVLTPIYNTKPEFLRECINSVLDQTFGDFEFLLCDDCSESYIRDIVESYNDPRIIYIRNQKNLGAAGSRNRLIDMANGDYLALLDSDDTMVETRLAKQVDFLDKNPAVGCLGTWATVNKSSLFHPGRFDSQQLEEHLVFSGCALCNSSVMLRKSTLDKHHIRYKTEFIPAEDYALYCDLIGLTKFAVLPEVLCDYKFYSENISCCQEQKQKYIAAVAQYNVIERYANVSLVGKEEMANFAAFNIPQNSKELRRAIKINLDKLKEFPRWAEMFFNTNKNCYRLICYKKRSLTDQARLLCSPLRRFFKQSFGWQLFCFITRGMFSFKK